MSTEPSHSTIDSTYASVGQQTGIYAGSGGFQINVGGNTGLTGAVIASGAPANENSLTTGTLTYSDIQNHAQYSADTVGFSVSGSLVGMALSNTAMALSGQFGSASGVTRSAIGPAEVAVLADAVTGADSVAGLSRDTGAANGAIKQIFDLQQVQNNIQVQQAIGQLGMEVAGSAAGALEANANKQLVADQAAGADEATLAADREAVAAWGDDGAARIALHAAVAGIGAGLGGGNVGGAIAGTIAGDAAAHLVQSAIGDATAGLDPALAGMVGKLVTNTVATAAGAVAGGLVGGGQGAISGAGYASDADAFNRQLHPNELQRIKELANGDPVEEQRLQAAACAMVHCAAQFPVGSPQYDQLEQLEQVGASAGYAKEYAMLSDQTGAELFTYSTGLVSDQSWDSARNINSTYQITTRAGGVIQFAGGTFGAVASSTACATAAGCALGIAGMLYSIDQMNAGLGAALNGQPQEAVGQQILGSTGLSLQLANLIYNSAGAVILAGGSVATSIMRGASSATEGAGNALATESVGADFVEGQASNVRMYPDGSLRTPDGKFASVSGMPAPGTTAAKNYAQFLSDNGVNVAGTELEVEGPLGVRRYDIGTYNPDGSIFGLEIKTGGATPDSYQTFSDMYINRFGAVGRGRIAGVPVTGSMTIYLPSGGF